MNLNLRLDSKSISHAIGELKRYKNDLAIKTEVFVRRLIDAGISVAEKNTGGFGKYISFSKEGKGGIRTVGYLVAEDRSITVEWDYKGEKRTAKLSPLLMAEFGSGKLAEVLFAISGVGQGTFPGQTHAFDEKGWNYKEWQDDHKGKWHHSVGYAPTHPMYKADMEMIQKVEEIAREVFHDI